MTPIIFSPSDLLAQNQRACVGLLKALAMPPSAGSKKPTSSNVGQISFQRRRQVALCYLTSIVLPRLDELVPTRGSAVPLCRLKCSGDLMVDALWDLATTNEGKQPISHPPAVLGRGIRRTAPDQPKTNASSGADASSSSVLDLKTALSTRPFLLVKAKLLRKTPFRSLEHTAVIQSDHRLLFFYFHPIGHLDPLLRRTLAQLLTMEGKQLNLSTTDDDVRTDRSNRPQTVRSSALQAPRLWSDCLPAQLTPGSGSGALAGANPGYTLKLVADILRLLQPMVIYVDSPCLCLCRASLFKSSPPRCFVLF